MARRARAPVRPHIRQAIGDFADVQHVGAPGSHVNLIAIAQLAIQTDLDELVTRLDPYRIPVRRNQFADLSP